MQQPMYIATWKKADPKKPERREGTGHRVLDKVFEYMFRPRRPPAR